MSDPAPTDLLDAFLGSSPDMLFVAAGDGRLRAVSRGLRDTLDLAPANDLPLTALAHPGDRAALSIALSHLRRSQKPVQFDLRLRDARGVYRPLSCHAASTPGGDTIHGHLRTRPDPRPRRIKERLFDAMLDYLPAAVWALDPAGDYIYNDGQLLLSNGYERGSFLGQNMLALHGAIDGVTVNVKRALAGEPVHYFNEHGGYTWENWIIPLHDAQGKLSLVLGFTLDVSAMSRVEREMRQRLAEIEQQQEVIRRLSTPIIEVWDGVLTLPMLGVLDSIRTADVLQSVLTHISQRGTRFAILDLTGVEVVDTRVAGYLIRLISAVRLLGAEGIVAGIRPTVAQTIVALGADLSQIVTHRNLRTALAHCIRQMAPALAPNRSRRLPHG
ncbi:STAS domain-containing protein [Chondromyces crocatus]|uniref:Anti-anti-sigma factor n=1 Tax=Chondromyces crocatus TaxID=52 RepID=A0A0K1EB83_CHOCO|nr:STAS domain-containing protein [Chondromyces crocatus]AKT38104.1 anti-anti-sigma factor [Chondromyces crocatus]